ncbi:hypothetical protein CPB83DRAFT_951732 [Crepidotus variabilis]|uniref:Uncharacterized protein n=1 Tax=Crepidotus variabilis TaxID=179855 RepID=A0A9P6JJY7_9AGAR|nr:hypothetical protein CPB83DRAFT_951732 [Crepidotus variabilis]
MNGCSMVDYSGGTAFVGLGALRPTALTLFQFAAFADPLGEITLQQVSFTTAVIGTGIVFAHYAGLLDNNAVSKVKLPALAQVQNITVADVEAAVGIHWMDLPAGYFPSKVDAHTDNGESCVLQSPFETGYSAAEKLKVKWLNYPAGYFPQNVPTYNDDGTFSQLESIFEPQIIFCTPDNAPPPPKWFVNYTELYSEFIPSKLDPFVDDEVPLGYTEHLVCPADSEKAERAFDLFRNPPTQVQFTPTTVQFTLDTPTGFNQILTIAITVLLTVTLGVMLFVIQAGQALVEDILEDKFVLETVNEEDSAQDILEEHKEHTNEAQRNDEEASDQEFVLEVVEQVKSPAELPIEEAVDSGDPNAEIAADFDNSLPIEAEEATIPTIKEVLKHIQAVEERYWSGEFGEVLNDKVPEEKVSGDVLEAKNPADPPPGRRRRRRRKNPAADDTQTANNLAEDSGSATIPIVSISAPASVSEDTSESGEVKKRRNRDSNRKRPPRGAAAAYRNA